MAEPITTAEAKAQLDEKRIREIFDEMTKNIIAEIVALSEKRIEILPSPYFDAVVEGCAAKAAAPMAAEAGKTGAEGAAFAKGTDFPVRGHSGVDRNVLRLNDLPIARISKGERFGFSRRRASLWKRFAARVRRLFA